MANICMYKIKVCGSKKACYKLINIMPAYSGEKTIIDEYGKDDSYTVIFQGDCKWSIDSYTSKTKVKPLSDIAIDSIQDGDYWDIPVSNKSILLGCEIFCNSMDIDDGDDADYIHYNKGKRIYDDCPSELEIECNYEEDEADPLIIYYEDIATCKVKFEDGRSISYRGEYEINDLVIVESATKDKCGKVVEVNKHDSGYNIEKILKKVGHVGEFIEDDVAKIWDSYPLKERRQYLKSINFETNITKRKFILLVENQWNKYSLTNNNWEEFLSPFK